MLIRGGFNPLPHKEEKIKMKRETCTITKKMTLDTEERKLISNIYEIVKEIAVTQNRDFDETLVEVIDQLYDDGFWENEEAYY